MKEVGFLGVVIGPDRIKIKEKEDERSVGLARESRIYKSS